MSEHTCPLPTPELAAALANQYIERHRQTGDPTTAMARAFADIVGPFDREDRRSAFLMAAASSLAEMLGWPAPYETQVTLPDGSTLPPERHTITYFTDGEPGFDGHGFTHEDWACVAALEVGESYIVKGESAFMTVTRKE